METGTWCNESSRHKAKYNIRSGELVYRQRTVQSANFLTDCTLDHRQGMLKITEQRLPPALRMIRKNLLIGNSIDLLLASNTLVRSEAAYVSRSQKQVIKPWT